MVVKTLARSSTIETRQVAGLFKGSLTTSVVLRLIGWGRNFSGLWILYRLGSQRCCAILRGDLVVGAENSLHKSGHMYMCTRTV